MMPIEKREWQPSFAGISPRTLTELFDIGMRTCGMEQVV